MNLVIQLHQSKDGKSFASLEEARRHNETLSVSAFEDLYSLIIRTCKLSDDDKDDVVDMCIDNRDQMLKILLYLV